MDWIAQEYNSLKLGDKRLNKRAKQLLKNFSDNPTKSIPNSCKSWTETKAAYRFFDNPLVNAKKVIKPHRLATLERIKARPIVLLIEDTTTLNYSGQKERDDIGPIQQDNVRGLFLHPMLAVTPERECLGVVDYELWARESFTHLSAKERKAARASKAIKDKESYRWVKGYKKATKLSRALPDTQFIYVADREGDVYDIYHEAQAAFAKGAADWLIRATYDRATLDEKAPKKRNRLKKEVKACSSLGTISFDLAPARNRKKRAVTQDIFVKKVTLRPPREKEKAGFKPVTITTLIAMETNPPPGQKAIEWTLLTSVAISNLEEALQVIQWYLCRWQIEIFFKILKSGCTIEKLQINEKERFDPCLALYLIVAWRILFMTMLGRESPELSSECIFEAIEWQTAYIMIYKKPPPDKPPSLRDTLRMIAQLGGFLGRKHDGEPGTVVMWRGLQCLYDYIKAREVFTNAFGHTYG
jgi:hypothetical protein